MNPVASDPQDLFDSVTGLTITSGELTDDGVIITLDNGMMMMIQGQFIIYTGRSVRPTFN